MIRTVRVKAVSAKHRILTGLSRLATSKVVPSGPPETRDGLLAATWSKLGVQDWIKREVLPPTYDGKGVEASWLRTSVEIRDRHDAIPS